MNIPDSIELMLPSLASSALPDVDVTAESCCPPNDCHRETVKEIRPEESWMNTKWG